MKEFTMTYSTQGYAYVTVKAENMEEAKQKAETIMNETDFNLDDVEYYLHDAADENSNMTYFD